VSLLCAPITLDDADAALADAREAQGLGVDMVEWRVDALLQTSIEGGLDPENALSRVMRVVRESPSPCIVTCRAESEGGAYAGDDGLLLDLLQRLAAADHPPRFVDLEFETWRASPSLQSAARPAGCEPPFGLILSLHDFDGRPSDLLRRLADMRAAPAEILKIAWRARSLRDNLEIFELLRTRDRPIIALGMGEFGLMSRVLAPKFGGFLTFASLRDETATAPGQPTIRDLLDVYRFRSIGASTRLFGVIGSPVSHSMSPALHNLGFERAGVDGVYLPLPVPPEWEHFKATLGALADDPALDFAGASVTIPHKEHLVRFAEERSEEGWIVDDLSRVCGAANTIARTAHGWSVSNTDGPAIVDCLLDGMAGDVRGRRVAVLGAGGAAAAGAAALMRAGAAVTVYNRSQDRVDSLVARLRTSSWGEVGEIDSRAWAQRVEAPVDAVVNCTPLGMRAGPAPDESPLDAAALERLAPGTVVMDTVYNPPETSLLREAKGRGLTVVDGVSMFVRQAAAQFQIWIGRTPPTDAFDRIVRDRLAPKEGA